MVFILNRECLEEMIKYVKDELPNEGCGILAGKDGKVLKVYKMTNTDKSPSTFFMEPQEQFDAMKDMRRLGIEMIGIYHSHVASPAYPSLRDVKLAFYPDVYYVIISLMDKENPQVRVFRIQEGNISEEKIIGCHIRHVSNFLKHAALFQERKGEYHND